MEQREQIRAKTTYQGKSLAERLALLPQKSGYNLSQSSQMQMKNHIERIQGLSSKLPTTKVPAGIEWLNTRDSQPWSFQDQLKGKFVVVDFWSSCCINCIHVLAEMDRLEELFGDLPEVAFVGCHSAKFENEKDLHMLRQAIVRYDIKHAVINDNEFRFWGSQGVNCWPTVMVFSPDSKPLFKTTGERCEEDVGAILYQALLNCKDQIESNEGAPSSWIDVLSAHELPFQLEKDKQRAQELTALQNGGGAAAQNSLSQEAILALRQNMNHPGKLITVRAAEGQAALPYSDVSELLVIADSANNRYLILNADTNEFIE